MPTKRSPGRPKKSPVKKRSPGRPKKSPVKKRSPGRPKKSSVKKRSPGRPKKSPVKKRSSGKPKTKESGKRRIRKSGYGKNPGGYVKYSPVARKGGPVYSPIEIEKRRLNFYNTAPLAKGVAYRAGDNVLDNDEQTSLGTVDYLINLMEADYNRYAGDNSFTEFIDATKTFLASQGLNYKYQLDFTTNLDRNTNTKKHNLYISYYPLPLNEKGKRYAPREMCNHYHIYKQYNYGRSYYSFIEGKDGWIAPCTSRRNRVSGIQSEGFIIDINHLTLGSTTMQEKVQRLARSQTLKLITTFINNKDIKPTFMQNEIKNDTIFRNNFDNALRVRPQLVVQRTINSAGKSGAAQTAPVKGRIQANVLSNIGSREKSRMQTGAASASPGRSGQKPLTKKESLINNMKKELNAIIIQMRDPAMTMEKRKQLLEVKKKYIEMIEKQKNS
jgi:hypothetical protein